jgi:hypothetical protein
VPRRIQSKSVFFGFQGFAVFQNDGTGLLEVFREQELGIGSKNGMVVPGGMVGVGVGNKTGLFPATGVQPQVQFREVHSLAEYYLHVFWPWNGNIVPLQYIILPPQGL